MEKIYQFKTLLGHKNLEFSIACLGSFIKNSADKIALTIFEDGTITDQDQDKLCSALPGVVIVYKAERDSVVNEKLVHCPSCMAYRRQSPYAQKLFDVMLMDTSDLCFIDSDVYFMRRFQFPAFSHVPVFIRDGQNAYSFNPAQFMSIRSPIVGRVNTGLFFFPYEYYDLEFLEKLLADARIRKGHQRLFWLEQTLWAFLAGRVRTNQFFDDTQIKMAGQELSVNDHTIAVHLVSSFRFQFEYLSSLQISEDDLPERIRLVNSSKVLNKYEFAIDRLKKGIYRRIGISQ
ncbi:MAG TPA: hypothetical protein VFT90_04430 [Chryseosolibacter sp.]|nr:hypothetical protein [Chryseosolibacter sp.]